MSHTNPRADRRPLGESRRGLDEKMFFLIFTPWPSTKILADPGLDRRAHQFYVPRSNHYAIRTWLNFFSDRLPNQCHRCDTKGQNNLVYAQRIQSISVPIRSRRTAKSASLVLGWAIDEVCS